METVTEAQLNNIKLKLTGDSQVLIATVAKLYTNDGTNHNWLYSNLAGAFCIVVDPDLHAVLLRLYDLNSYEVLFETELYYDFNDYLLELNSCFYCFPIEAGQIGISFAKAGEARNFAAKIRQVSPKTSEGNFKLPTDLWDEENDQFDMSKLTPEAKQLIRQSGVKKNMLKQRETAAQIYMDLTVAQAKTLADRAYQGEIIPEAELVHLDSSSQSSGSIVKRETLTMAKSALMKHISRLSVKKPEPQPVKENFEDYFRAQINARGAELSKYELSDSESDWSD